MFDRTKKVILGVLLATFLGVTVLGTFAPATPAKAQFQVGVINSTPDTVKQVFDQIWEGLKAALINAVTRLVAYVLRKVAYDGAVWLASGGKGQTPFAHTKSFGDYIKNVGDEAVGAAIEEMGKPFGLNLCQIPDIKVDLALKVGLRTGLPTGGGGGPPPKPACSLTEFSKNWLNGDAWKSKYTGDALTKRFNTSLAFDDSDLGIALEAKSKINSKVTTVKEGASLQRAEGQGFLPKKGLIDNRISTPAQLSGEGFKGATPDKQAAKDQDQLQALLASGNIRVIPSALGIFVNTLVSTMVKNYQEQGILPFGVGCVGENNPNCKADVASLYGDAGVMGGRKAAEDLFSSFLDPVKITVDEKYDFIADLGNCEGNGLYNCRADDKMILAIQQAKTKQPATIGEALQKGWLHGDWKLIPATRVADNMNKNFCKTAYCASNIKVLRQLRILPVGFEIAVENSNPDRPWTLKQVIDGFNDCNVTKNNDGEIVSVTYDESKPFCHLIDPSWVIALPESRCNAKINGPAPLFQGVPDRVEDCADVQSCVAYNSDGTCKNFGYCTAEKNIWRFNADSCSPQFRTCKAFQSANGQTVAYIARTLDSSYCSQDTIGCRAFSLNQNASGVWQPITSPQPANNYELTGVHLNSKASATCSGNAAGCSAFTTPLASGPLFVKKAPSYLKCYDMNPATEPIDWPQNAADIAKIQARPECAQYAGVCIPDEVSCNWYTSVNDSANKIPGRFKPASIAGGQVVWNDQCDAKCVGYAAYKELATPYSNGQSLAYIIPSTAQTCTVQDEGCSSFTNLETTQNGLEKTEYFSYLRPCVTAAKDKGATFITYEGSIVGGIQLKTYTLVVNKQGDADAGNNGPIGAPKYFYKDAVELADLNQQCNEARYKAGTAPVDCRQFNDDQGTVYYRLLAHTIPVTNACTSYRLNSPEFYVDNKYQNDANGCSAAKGFYQQSSGVCQKCLQGGEYINGACVYQGLPGDQINSAGSSRVCAAAVDTCRAYKGNNGNNIREIFNDTFESPSSSVALALWSQAPINISAESAKVGEHSLEYTGAAGPIKTVSLTPGKSYDLTFWAKGSGAAITVKATSIDKSFTKDFGVVRVNDAWGYYHLGPVEMAGATTTIQLSFTNQNNGKLFLDNVRLVEVTSYLYLVKKTLTVDPVCDSDPTDNLPGEALGCNAYSTPNNQNFYLTGFSYLCREGAIGCTSLYDTQNTINDSGARAYNVWITGAPGKTAKATVKGNNYSCSVPGDRAGCYVNINGVEASDIKAALGNGSFTPSTVYIPPDTPSTTPMYLVANQAAACSQVDLGCMVAGQEESTPNGKKYATTTIKVNPDDANFSSSLCQSEAVGCNAYVNGAATTFFKDPAFTGQKVCTYRSGVLISGVKRDGWFLKGYGTCSVNKSTYCTKDADCGTLGGKCENIDATACYPNYLTGNGNYEMWSSGDPNYRNFVGECPTDQNTCTEYVDHNDADYSYYLKNNGVLSGKECNGQISLKDGCALFDQTENPRKFWNTTTTYRLVEKTNQSQAPISAGTNDANIILKVQRDRVCGEWLQCKASHKVWDAKNNRYKTICDEVGRCDKSPDSNTDGNSDSCSNWVDGRHEYSGKILSNDIYTVRDVTWKGRELSGYSVPGLYPIEELSQITIYQDTTDQVSWRLAKKIPCGGGGVCDPAVDPIYGCKSPIIPVGCGANVDFVEPCPVLPSCGKSNEGVCINSTCVQNPDSSTNDIYNTLPSQVCRAYPEKGSPFPNTPAIAKDSQNFQGVNLCSEIKSPSSDKAISQSCECDYTKVQYSDSITKYWNYSFPNSIQIVPGSTAGQVPAGICQGGTRDGQICQQDNWCSYYDGKQYITDGVCLKLKEQRKMLGWRGYCLEYDLSRTLNADPRQHPCISWLPVDSLLGAPDINNQHMEAGYVNPSSPGRYYCLNASGIANQKANWQSNPTDSFLNTPRDLTFGSRGITNSKCDNEDGYGAPAREWDIICDDNNLIDFARSSRADEDPALAESDIKQTDVEKIIIQVVKSDKVDPKLDDVFEIYPNDFTSFSGTSQMSYTGLKTANGSSEPGTAVTGRYLNRDNEFVLFYSSFDPGKRDNYIDKEGNINGPNVVGNIFKTAGLVSPVKPDSEGLWDKSTDNSEFCKRGDDFNWHAIRFKFDKNNKKFLGYSVAYCNRTADRGDIWHGEVTYRITFKLKQWCSYIADTYQDYPPLGQNNTAARTNILWNTKSVIPTLGYNYFFATQPFGSLGYGGTLMGADQIIMTPPVLPEADKCSEHNLKDAKMETCTSKLNRDIGWVPGAPYSCSGKGCVRTEALNNTAKLLALTTPAPFPSTLKQGKDYLGLYAFARVKNVYNFNSSTKPINDSFAYRGYDLGDGSETKNFNFTNKGSPVKIFPLGTCDTKGRCLEERQPQYVNRLTINGEVDKDVVITKGTPEVKLQFFAHADDDQMPIRRISIDWGIINGAIYKYDGLYRNHRGLVQSTCNVGGNCEYQLTDGAAPVVIPNNGNACTNNNQCGKIELCTYNKKFGYLLDQTCDSDYFEFSYTYQCTKNSPNYTNDPAKYDARAFPNGACIFNPKVLVEDNWGWCNGDNRCGARFGDPGCYNGFQIGGFDMCGDIKRKDVGASFNKQIFIAPQ